MSCIHIAGTRRVAINGCPPFQFTGKRDRAAEVAQNAKHTNPKVRATAAASPHATQALLLELSHDAEPIVREWVARNTITSPVVLAGLLNDEHAPIRAFVAWNPNCTVRVLRWLLEDEDTQVRQVAKMVLDNRS